MKIQFYSRYFILALITCHFLPALANQDDEDFGDNRSKFQSQIDFLVKAAKRTAVLGSRTCDYATALELVKPELFKGNREKRGDSKLWSQNRGIDGYFNTLLDKSPCFKMLATKFGKNQFDVTMKFKFPEGNDPSGKMMVESELNFDPKPGILASAGEAPFKEFEKDWYRQLALKATKGNPLLAMLLVGRCGHDDQSHGDTNPQIAITNELQYQAYLALNPANSDKGKVIREERESKEKNGQNIFPIEVKLPSLSLLCFMGSHPAFAPGSVGSDISDEMKKKVIDAVGPLRGGAQNIAAKYYHEIAGMLQGCLYATRCQSSPKQAGSVAGQMGQLYRIARWEESTEKLSALRSLLIKSVPGLKKKFDELKKSRLAMTEKGLLTARGAELHVWDRMDAQDKAGIVAFIGKTADEITKGDHENDGVKGLMEEFMMEGKFGDRENKYTADAILAQIDAGSCARTGVDLDQCWHRRGLSPERKKRALQIVKSWPVEREWTKEQHRTGAEEGAKFCSQDYQGKNGLINKNTELNLEAFDKMACQALIDDPAQPAGQAAQPGSNER